MKDYYQQSIKALQLAGLSERTQHCYTRSVRQLVEFYKLSPKKITEQQVQDYFLHRRNKDKWSAATLRIAQSGIKFFFTNVLKRDWHTFNYLNAKRERRLPCILSREEVFRILGKVKTFHNYAFLSTVYACGLRLLVARNSRLPLYYCAYPGNLHDSRQFEAVMDRMFAVACGLNRTKERLTVVIDKGMNSEGNFAWIDEHARIHFVTSYSTYFAQELAAIGLDQFEVAETAKNQKLVQQDKAHNRILAHRTKGEYWGKQRAVVITYNPATARKQTYTLECKLDTIREQLLSMRTKVREHKPHWRNPDAIKERYIRLCEQLHVPADLYSLQFSSTSDGLSMSFRKDVVRVERKQALFGKNIIITDNTDWTTAQIVEASLDRWQVEDRFRLSKDNDLVAMQPIRHWTDSKIRCHLFTCVVAMTYLRMIELKLIAAGINRSAEDVMDDMRHLHSVLLLRAGARKPERRMEIPTKTQAEVLSTFGHYVDAGGVLQPMSV